MRTVVGIDRKIKRTWMDAILDRLVQTTDEADLRSFLDEYLKEELPGKESRAKTTGIMLRIWSGIPRERVALRDRAVAMLPRIPGQERIWLHWGMAALAYPFFRDTAEVVGRLLSLQDDFTTAQVQGRMLTTWGDRATSREAAQKLLTTLVDWEVLRATKTKGHFLLARKLTASIPDLQLWLLEALLSASTADEIEAQQLLRLPEAFPFSVSIGVSNLRRYEGFNIHRQGLDMDMVAPRRVKLEPPPKTTRQKKKTPARTDHGTLFDMQTEEAVPRNGKRPRASIVAPPVTPRPEPPAPVAELPKVEEPIRDTPFDSAPLIECAKQFREGRYLGCIALTQAVLEALIRHVCQVKLKKKPDQAASFERNVEAMHRKNYINEERKVMLDRMWADRYSFLHVRFSRESDRLKLQATARTWLTLLNDLERDFFGFTLRDGAVIPDSSERSSVTDTTSPATA